MRVKRLEIQGFKSFKDKTVVHFDHGITGIVGPNGCGKSNIVDAFFWVMGEQSYKHMRGNGSSDLIFNGSSKYSPLGLAEATLVMETDVVDTANAPAGATAADLPVHLKSKEISVTRRLYRSGEGEYFINGQPARLKDIHELFMDTGVGAKGYSVIEQGQIGKIVNAKPEERRLLIEEAAGIAKYKARKKESLRKMEATQANLSRLNDVVAEIERNLNSLERQAQKARQYKKYKEELLDKEMTWGRRKSQVLNQKLDTLKRQRDALEQELVGLKAELQVAENAIETDRVDQVTDTKQAEELQARIAQMSDELSREKSALDLSRRRQGDLSSQLQTLETEKDQLSTSIQEENARLAEREGQAEEADYAFREASDRAQAMNESVSQLRQETELARRQLETTKRELMTGVTQASDLTSRAAALLSRAESAREQAERVAQQLAEQETKIVSVREEAEKARLMADDVRSRREQLQSERKEQAAQLQTMEQSTRQLDRARDEASRSLTQLKSRLQSLEELDAAHEGFGDGPKAALEWARAHGGPLKAVTDSLKVEAGYEAALEGWLEKRIESLITEDAAAALSAIEHLREDKQGRAAIQLLSPQASNAASWDAVRGRLEATGFALRGQLSDFVKFSSAAGEALVRDVAVVESLSALPAILSSGSLDGWALVSMDGSALDHHGLLRGGSSEGDGAASVLKRKKAIEDLRAQAAEADARAQEAERTAADAKQALDLARARLQTLQADVQALEIQAAGLDRDVHQSSRALRDAESQLQALQRELENSRGAADRAAADREKLEVQIQEIISSRSDLETQIEAGESEVHGREIGLREQETELQSLKIGEASLRERAQSLKRELEASKSLIADRQRRLNEVNRTLDRASNEKQQFSGGEGSLEQHIEELTRALGGAREQLAEVKDRLEQSSAKVNSALDRIKELHKIGDVKTGESTHVALEIERLSGEVAHLVQNLEEKYGPGCLERPVTSPIQEEMTEPVVTHEMTAEEELLLGEEVERLRERIRRLGEVNVMAIEEFEETKKRHDYLLKEKADLEQSIQNLQEAIEHINKTSVDRFKKAFEAIADRFERLFPIVFGGGQAKLSLVYPEGSTDILEAGVDILAQPPGKKVTNMGLLSGGEKALTAVSLIFAIFMVKPSPFCLLDEVDAPLDDANIGKFNALLREMSAKSQFIIITHNKKTMELNDTLYGVTMEEPGVSKMVSIQLQ